MHLCKLPGQSRRSFPFDTNEMSAIFWTRQAPDGHRLRVCLSLRCENKKERPEPRSMRNSGLLVCLESVVAIVLNTFGIQVGLLLLGPPQFEVKKLSGMTKSPSPMAREG